MHTFKITFTLFFSLLLLQSCLAQTSPEVPVAEEYKSCCGTEPVEFAFRNEKVYVPNVFTPNGDGVNDYFMPYVNKEVGGVWGFTVYSARGDTILFQREYFNYDREIENYAWNGLRKDGSRYKGLFKYKMRVDDKAAVKQIVEGSACAIVCDPDAKIFRNKEGCFYPVQAGKEGDLDKNTENGESKCF